MRFYFTCFELIHNYLSNRKKRVRVSNSYSFCHYILFGVRQGSILGPLLFNIFLADLFFTLNSTEIANYADDTTPYAVSDNIDDLISSLRKSSKDLLKWLDDNLVKSNPDECHLLVSSCEKIKMEISNLRNRK